MEHKGAAINKILTKIVVLKANFETTTTTSRDRGAVRSRPASDSTNHKTRKLKTFVQTNHRAVTSQAVGGRQHVVYMETF